MKSEQEENYPGMITEPLEVLLSDKFYPWDILSTVDEEYTVISHKKTVDGYITRMAPMELILHKQFLYRYSQFMWGF